MTMSQVNDLMTVIYCITMASSVHADMVSVTPQCGDGGPITDVPHTQRVVPGPRYSPAAIPRHTAACHL